MVKGAVGGALKGADGLWHWAWIVIDVPDRYRIGDYNAAKRDLREQLGVHCGGPAVAERRMIYVEAISPQAMLALEIFFDGLRRANEPEQPEQAPET